MEEDDAEPQMGRRVNAQLQHDERLYRSTARRSRHIFSDDDEWE